MRPKVRWWAALVGLALLGTAAGTALVSSPRPPLTLTVAAAYDLQPAFQELSVLFEEQRDVRVELVFGSSGNLARQIENGAPMDVFASANQAYVADLQAKGLIMEGTRHLFAVGRLALVTYRGAGPGWKRLEDLLRPEVKYVALANPDHAPYGLAARQALETAGIWEMVRPKLVYGEDVRQALQFVQSGNAEAGLVALSLAQASEASYVLIAEGLHDPLRQDIAVVRGAPREAEARAFVDLVLGEQGRSILKKYGFVTPGER